MSDASLRHVWFKKLLLTFKKVKVHPAPMVHRVVPVSVSVALSHASANAVKTTVGGGGGPLVAPHV